MLVIGIGHEWRGDDAAGPVATRRIDEAPGRRVVQHDGELAGLVELLGSDDDVVVVDAVHSGAAPGTIHRIDATAEVFPFGLVASTHAFGLAEAIELARALGTLPARLRVVGIEAAAFTPGAPLSRAVAVAVDRVVAELTHA